MHTFGLSPKEAAKRAMDEVTGPVIAIPLSDIPHPSHT
jgi:multidrug efflux pump subunit AcrB